MAFPLMNLNTGLKDSELSSSFHEPDKIPSIIEKYEKIRNFLGPVILMSDGKLVKGYNKNLETLEGLFDISKHGERFYFGNGEDEIASHLYLTKNRKVFLGHLEIEKISQKERIVPFTGLYNRPFYTLEGLYKKYHKTLASNKNKLRFFRKVLNKN